MGLVSATIDRDTRTLNVVQDEVEGLDPAAVSIFIEGPGFRRGMACAAQKFSVPIVDVNGVHLVRQEITTGSLSKKEIRTDKLLVGGTEAVAEPVDESEASFDPADYSVHEVIDYLDANPDERHNIVAQEQLGKNRKTIVNYGQ